MSTPSLQLSYSVISIIKESKKNRKEAYFPLKDKITLKCFWKYV